MFARLVGESFVRNPRRVLLAAAALAVGMAVTTATLSVALDVGDRLALEFRSLGANLLVTPESDTLPLQIGGVDYRPVDEGAYLKEADLGKLKTVFWRHNILGFTPFLQQQADVSYSTKSLVTIPVTLIGTWYDHAVPVPDGSTFHSGAKLTHPWWKIRGRWFDDDAKEAVVGTGLVARLASEGLGGSPVLYPGAKIEISAGSGRGQERIPITITGVVSTGGTEDQAVLVPLSLAERIAGRPGQFRQLFVSALTEPEDAFSERDPSSMTATEYDRWYCSPYISSIGHQIEQVLPGASARPIRRVAETEGRVLTRVSGLLWLVTIAALVAAALAVAATSAAAMIERRSEVALMKALGATNLVMSGIFLAEQLVLAVVGGAIGFALGTVLARALGASVFGTPASFRVALLPVVLGLAALVALLGSAIPLRRAARFEPAPILRGE